MKIRFNEDNFIYTGQEYPAIVEFAPFQRIPKNRNRKNDSLCGTIDDDTDFQEFLRQLESEEHDHKPNQIAEHYFDLANGKSMKTVGKLFPAMSKCNIFLLVLIDNCPSMGFVGGNVKLIRTCTYYEVRNERISE